MSTRRRMPPDADWDARPREEVWVRAATRVLSGAPSRQQTLSQQTLSQMRAQMIQDAYNRVQEQRDLAAVNARYFGQQMTAPQIDWGVYQTLSGIGASMQNAQVDAALRAWRSLSHPTFLDER